MLNGIDNDSAGRTETILKDDEGPLPQLCQKIHARVHAFINAEPGNERLRAVQEQTRLSLRIIEEALDRYSLDDLSISYNGGKDCLVLLVLYLCALHTHFNPTPLSTTITTSKPHRSTLPQTLNSVYILAHDPFPEVDTFVTSSTKTYHLSLSRYQKPMREAFTSYLHDEPSIRAIFVGTRRTDPHGAELQYFAPTDHGWPDFMRIHPVIDWRYADVWTFIRHIGIPYCGLYDMGYTSLGGLGDTEKNPVLAVDGGAAGFRPAYELVEDEDERLGRVVAEKR
ncbi:adenine nucleotide alpha hydrolases-like protein [Polychaeton citri CBS 116435]|uniref:FAD synthase n=1 Tax=Polychaeton citri CBS 116435 TaxID=1314669 RepID=A0A9P4PYV8_9PEZI|nr:adenine nucleotide alpha hydrolases-like protein [Polychaeton citri CBS 116435]